MLSVFIIGYGNVGTFLAEKLDSSIKILGVYDPYKHNKEDNKDVPFFADITSIPLEYFTKADIIILTVNDDAIPLVTRELIHSIPPVSLKGIVHTSGNFSSEILDPLHAHFGAKVASFHPYMTFIGERLPERKFYWGFEGDSHLLGQCEKIAEACNSRVFQMNPEEKKLYHISGVFASNFLIAHLRITSRLLQQSIKTGEDEEEKIKAAQVLLPLIQQTLENVQNSNLSIALSGPLKRNDLSTLRSHMVELEAKTPDLAYLYNFYSIELIDLLEAANIPISNDIKRFFEL
jgi:predicted short-subunit dehydrogenase-like oxidoreductase (DUF2520 family)